MNRTQNADIMKRLQLISVLSIVSCTLLSSCTLLESSPLPRERRHHHDAHYGSSYNDKTYHGTFQVPAEGGIYEFDCADDDFFISHIMDSSMPMPAAPQGRCAPSVEAGRHVNALTYDGPFYTITCHPEKHNWVIEVDPLRVTQWGRNEREVMVFMSDESDYSDFVFLFEQKGDSEPLEYIR